MGIFDFFRSRESQPNTSELSQKASYKKGDFIGTNYEVYDVLGEGGFGIVYLVYSHELSAVVAFKTLRDEYLDDIKTKERFRREAQVWIDLEHHPYLVRAHAVEEISGRLYIAMEHVASYEPGMNTLEGYLKHRPPDLAQSLKWALQFCHGMEHAYSKGVKAHRDIKPANIMIAQNKTVKITDFGLAGGLAESSSSAQNMVAGKTENNSLMQTVIGSSIGTPEYMSPEQFADLSACDERSDIYSFGIVLYRMAADGRLPFFTDSPTYRWTALKYFHQETTIPTLNSLLFPIIQRCLEKEPGKRYQTFKELRADLEFYLKRETGEIVKVPELKELEVWELGNKGVSLVTLGKHQEAIVCYDRALEINPVYAKAWFNKGSVLVRLGKSQESIACYDRALEINPRDADAWNNKGNALGNLGRNQESIACYNRALEIDPRYNNALNNKGNALRNLGKDQEAIACYDKALDINPGDAKVWYNKGNALRNLGKDQEAIACYDRVLEIDHRDADAWDNKGIILARLGKHQEAIDCFDRTLEIDHRNVVPMYNKALAEDKLGKIQEARYSYERFLRMLRHPSRRSLPLPDPAMIDHARKRIEELSK